MSELGLEEKVRRIEETFKPSTTFEQGELLQTDYESWSKNVVPKQMQDWNRIKRLLRGTWGKLDWRYRGWVFDHFRAKYNWRGWAINEGMELILSFQNQKKFSEKRVVSEGAGQK